MSIALKNFNGLNTPILRIQEDSVLRMLLVVCSAIALPSLVLMLFLDGWVQYVFAAIVAINIVVPVLAYFTTPPFPELPPEDFLMSRPQGAVGQVMLPLTQHVSVVKVSDKV
jgi:hypothetical protein